MINDLSCNQLLKMDCLHKVTSLQLLSNFPIVEERQVDSCLSQGNQRKQPLPVWTQFSRKADYLSGWLKSSFITWINRESEVFCSFFTDKSTVALPA